MMEAIGESGPAAAPAAPPPEAPDPDDPFGMPPLAMDPGQPPAGFGADLLFFVERLVGRAAPELFRQWEALLSRYDLTPPAGAPRVGRQRTALPSPPASLFW